MCFGSWEATSVHIPSPEGTLWCPVFNDATAPLCAHHWCACMCIWPLSNSSYIIEWFPWLRHSWEKAGTQICPFQKSDGHCRGELQMKCLSATIFVKISPGGGQSRSISWFIDLLWFLETACPKKSSLMELHYLSLFPLWSIRTDICAFFKNQQRGFLLLRFAVRDQSWVAIHENNHSQSLGKILAPHPVFKVRTACLYHWITCVIVWRWKTKQTNQ